MINRKIVKQRIAIRTNVNKIDSSKIKFIRNANLVENKSLKKDSFS